MEVRTLGKQIRCIVSAKKYDELKKQSKKVGLTLSQFAGMKLSGFDVVESAKERIITNKCG